MWNFHKNVTTTLLWQGGGGRRGESYDWWNCLDYLRPKPPRMYPLYLELYPPLTLIELLGEIVEAVAAQPITIATPPITIA